MPVVSEMRMESWLRSEKEKTTVRSVEVLPLPKFQSDVVPYSDRSANWTEGFSESI